MPKRTPAPPKIANRIVEYGTKPADQFQANPANWRKHPQVQRDALAGVLESVGWAAPVIENKRTGNLIDGHERVWQAQQAGNLDVPYVLVDVSENEERTLLTTLDPIGALAETDRDKLAELIADVRSDDNRVQALIAGIAERENIILPDETGHVPLDDVPPEIDRAAELQKEWGTARGQVWTCGKHRVMCGDSTSADDVATLMGGEKARYGMHDPPYGISVVGGSKSFGSVGGSNVVKVNKYAPIDGDDKPFDPSFLLDYSDDMIIWGGNYFADKLPCRKGWLVWDKKGREWRDNFSDCEMAWTTLPTVARIYRYVWMGMVQSGEREERQHPTQKPVGLFVQIMHDLFTEEGRVADYFLGSGTTLIAAEQTGRVCYGMEISPAYVAVTLQRYKDVTGNTPVLA